MSPSTAYRYRVVDVFTEEPLAGNALAVFPDASALDGATMQRIAKELNLSETSFILPPTREDCAARVRIFTPARELPFAGHPTIGTGFVLFDEGLQPGNDGGFVLEEGVGPVAVRVEPGPHPMLWLTTPPITIGRTYDAGLCAGVLGLASDDLLDIAPELLSAGNPAVFVALRDKAAVDRARLDLAGGQQLRGADAERICVFVFTPTPDGAYSRMFAPELGIVEDPGTGSVTGPLALYMMRHGLVSSASGTRFVSEQGTLMGRRCLLHVHIRGEGGVEGIDVGGHVTPLVTASMSVG